MNDEQIANRTDRGCLYLVLGTIAAGVVIAWLYAKSIGL